MKRNNVKIIRGWLLFFIVGLLVSGLTAIPVQPELRWLTQFVPSDTSAHMWLNRVQSAYAMVQDKCMFLLYGYDWLAFAHFILAILFIGPLIDPVKNIWVIQFGIIACILVLPLAFIAGHFRGIPPGWQLIDCSFGVIGLTPLWICYRKIKSLQIGPDYESLH